MNPACDHRSVGVVIEDEQKRVLVVDDERRPGGLGPVTGHVDDHGGYQAAARAEVAGQVALTVRALNQVASGWRDDRCRRPVRSAVAGHNWRIYTAVAAAEPQPSGHIVQAVRWLTRPQLQSLADRTITHALGGLTDEAFAARPGLEPAWLGWLATLAVVSATPEHLALVAHVAVHGSNQPAPEEPR